jgi:hypothetical protein
MLIDYRWLQSGTALRKLERKNFLEKKAKMQWWYVDVVMSDGSVLLLAFVPKKWWPDTVGANLDDALVMVAMLGGTDRKLRSASTTLDASRMRSSDGALRLDIPGGLTIVRDREEPATYRFTLDLPEVQGSLEVRAVARPFSAFPGGKLPGLGRAALLGGRLGTEAFSYVSQVPRGTASGELTFGSERIVIDGKAYHEQGRFDEAPERLSKKGWFWVHFLHPEWNVFGSPGVFLYVQEQQDRPIFHGFNMFDRSLGFKNRTLAGAPSHHQVFSGGEMRFAYGGLKLSIMADPKRTMPLISFPSATTKQIYHTLVTDAELTVERRGATNSFAGQMILESCWIGL